MAHTTRLDRRADGGELTLPADVLDAARLPRGAAVQVSASPGRVVVTAAEPEHARSLALFERSVERYARTYAILAK